MSDLTLLQVSTLVHNSDEIGSLNLFAILILLIIQLIQS